MSIVVNRQGPTNIDLLKRRRSETCWICGEAVGGLKTLDANNKPVCSNCLPERYRGPFEQPEPADDDPVTDR